MGNFIAADFVTHNSADATIIGPEDYGRAMAAHRTAFPT